MASVIYVFHIASLYDRRGDGIAGADMLEIFNEYMCWCVTCCILTTNTTKQMEANCHNERIDERKSCLMTGCHCIDLLTSQIQQYIVNIYSHNSTLFSAYDYCMHYTAAVICTCVGALCILSIYTLIAFVSDIRIPLQLDYHTHSNIHVTQFTTGSPEFAGFS